jgi:hypothetical protein
VRDERGPWYLLTGLIIGAALGVFYAWMVQPVLYTDTAPSMLRADFKDSYRLLISAAYAANQDLLRATERLKLLQDADAYRALAEQAQRLLAQGELTAEVRALGMLAAALGGQGGQSPPPAAPSPQFSPSPAADTPTRPPATLQATVTRTPTAAYQTPTVQRPTRTPTASATPLPSRTPTLAPGASFKLESEELLCQAGQIEPQIQVEVLDAQGQGVAGIEAAVSWAGGSEQFFTGLQPEKGLGYADFSMTPGVIYTLQLARGGEIIPNLAAQECQSADGGRFWGVWKLVFSQP